MLVEFTRATAQNPDAIGEDDGAQVVRKAAIRPEGVAAYFEDAAAPGVVIIRFMDGRGFQVRGSYAEVQERLGVPMLEFERALRQEDPTDVFGEDDGIEQQRAAPVVHKVAIKPQAVSAVFESTQAPDVVIIRLLDGRGLQVRGTYAQVQERLSAEGHLATQENSGESEELH